MIWALLGFAGAWATTSLFLWYRISTLQAQLTIAQIGKRNAEEALRHVKNRQTVDNVVDGISDAMVRRELFSSNDERRVPLGAAGADPDAG